MKYYHTVFFNGLYNQFVIYYQMLRRTFKKVVLVSKTDTSLTKATFRIANY